MSMTRLGLACAAFLAVVACEGAWATQVEGVAWTGRLADGEVLEVKGVTGEIEVTRARGGEARVYAEVVGHEEDVERVHVEVLEHRGGVTVCAVYPTPEGERENVCAPGSEGRMNTRRIDVQVHFTVELPAGMTFHGRNVNGDVEAVGLESDLVIHTVNGDIELSTTGFAEAQTVNGSIEAAMGDVPPRGGLQFQTVNGDIVLDVPDDIDADLDASWVNGGLESDLPFRLTGRVSRSRAEGQLGDGGPRLEVATVNGSIRIR